ncbi:MAG TPA: FtsX-like permease family protein [Streptosporangiaceae bacterium]
MVRWIRADLRTRPGQAVAMVLVVAGVVTALLLSATLFEGAANPWRALFAQTNGADIWLRLQPGTNTRPLHRLTGVDQVAGPYQATAATIVRGPQRAPVQLWAMSPALPATGRPLVREGRWLTTADPLGVVLEASFAQAIHVSTGATMDIDGLDGNEVHAVVIGIAYTSDQGSYPDQTPGLMWGLPGLVHAVEPVSRHTVEMAGLRLTDPSATGFAVQQAVTQLGSGAVISVSTWQDVERSVDGGDPLLGLLLALFGLVALGGALLAIGNAAGGRVLVQVQDLAMLKTLGFTPGQLVGMVVAEHAALGLAGEAAGIAVARLITEPLMRQVPAGTLAAVAPLQAGWVAAVAGGVAVALLLATVVPGWRAGRIWPVVAVRPPMPGKRLSRLARAALLTHLPPAVVLGARAAFTRRLPAVLTIAGLALPTMMITIGIGFWATLDNVQRHPGELGLAAALTVGPGELDRPQAVQLIDADQQVAAVYPVATVSALLPGETSTITTLGAGTSSQPFPFHVAGGRLYRAPGEAVASQGLLDAVHSGVGKYLRMPVGGVPVIFHVVGRIIEPEYGGQVLAYGLDTLTQAGAAAPPVSYSLVLRPGVSAPAAAAYLLNVSHGRLDVVQTVDPAANLSIVRPMLAGLFAVLGLIGLTSLVTASAVGLRDHLRDVAALRAMGLTPGQVTASLLTRMAVLALIATALGTAAGVALSTRLINLGGQVYGLGSGLGSPPSAAAVLLTAAAAIAAAAAAALLPARRAAQTPIAATLGP